MREIKFKAYLKDLGWVVPVSSIDFDYNEVEVDLSNGQGDTTNYYFSEVELLQYTGIKDENGKEIYEGDIVVKEYRLASNRNPFKGIVKFYEGVFWIDNGKDAVSLFSETHSVEIVGNKYKDMFRQANE